MSSDLALCVLCVRDTVTTRSRWSWLGCVTCREVSRLAGEWYGVRSALPLGRHSIMNGGVLQPAAATSTDIRRVADGLTGAVRRWGALEEWQRAEFDRLAEPFRATGPTAQLMEWRRRWPPSLGASVDAFDRYGVVPVPHDLSILREAQASISSDRPIPQSSDDRRPGTIRTMTDRDRHEHLVRAHRGRLLHPGACP